MSTVPLEPPGDEAIERRRYYALGYYYALLNGNADFRADLNRLHRDFPFDPHRQRHDAPPDRTQAELERLAERWGLPPQYGPEDLWLSLQLPKPRPIISPLAIRNRASPHSGTITLAARPSLRYDPTWDEPAEMRRAAQRIADELYADIIAQAEAIEHRAREAGAHPPPRHHQSRDALKTVAQRAYRAYALQKTDAQIAEIESREADERDKDISEQAIGASIHQWQRLFDLPPRPRGRRSKT